MTITHSKPSVSIFADASFYAEKSVSGWGGWARGDGRDSIIHGGPSPKCADSTAAELWALALFCERLSGDGYLLDDDVSIIIQSDSLHALNMLHTALANSHPAKKKHSSDSDIARHKVRRDCVDPVERITAALEHKQVVYLRHVKGHQGGKRARSWVNEQCDREAKKHARAQL